MSREHKACPSRIMVAPQWVLVHIDCSTASFYSRMSLLSKHTESRTHSLKLLKDAFASFLKYHPGLYDFQREKKNALVFGKIQAWPFVDLTVRWRKDFLFFLGFPEYFHHTINCTWFSRPRSLVFWVCFSTWQGFEDSCHWKPRWLSPLRWAAEYIKT